ncbi:MAG: FecR domain-containing protein [Burkholderiales bacterium]
MMVAVSIGGLATLAQANVPPQNVGAIAGSADFAIGNVTALSPDGKIRSIAKGEMILSGDRILTNEGRVQIRFTDGAYVSLLPHTEFRVQDYRYDGVSDGREAGFFGLIKGTARMVTGAIGRINRSRFQITTPTATIGVRGTGGIIEVSGDGTTLLIGTSGIWTLTNSAGTLIVPAGVAGVATPESTVPPRIASRSAVGVIAASNTGAAAKSAAASNQSNADPAPTRPAAPLTGIAVAFPFPVSESPGGCGSSASGSGSCGVGPAVSVSTAGAAGGPGGPATPAAPAVPATPPIPASPSNPSSPATPAEPTPEKPVAGTHIAAVAYSFDERIGDQVRISRGDGLFDATPVEFGPGGEVVRVGAIGIPAATTARSVRDFGSDGIVGWGRWVGNLEGADSGAKSDAGQNHGFHYVVGAITRNMPASNPGAQGFASFQLSHATSPTITGSSVPPGTLTTGAMGVDFTSRRVGIDLKTSFSGFQVQMSTVGGASNPTTSGVSYTGANATFGGNFGSVNVSGNAPANFCVGGCTGTVQGFFAGDAAARAGMVYRATTPGAPSAPELQGAAVFTRTR